MHDAVPEPLERGFRAAGPNTRRRMTRTYECMFLIDNDLVREDWSSAKAVVTSTLEKYGATIHTARRWDERALAYPIKGRRRATFLLTYFELDGQRSPELRRELEINDGVLRYMMVSADELPETEQEANAAESADDFEVPAPPADSVGTYRPIQTEDDLKEGEGEEGSEDGEKADGEKAEGDGEAKAEGDAAENGAAEKKAEGDAPAAEAAATTTPEAKSTEEESK